MNCLESICDFIRNDFFKINIAEFSTIIGAIIAIFQLIMIRRNSQDNSNPFVSLYLDRDLDKGSSFLLLKIKNFGKTPAFNIKIPKITTPKTVSMPVNFPKEIKYLAPGQEITSIYCIGQDISNFKLQNNKISYENNKGKSFETSFNLDTTSFHNNLYAKVPLEKISEILNEKL